MHNKKSIYHVPATKPFCNLISAFVQVEPKKICISKSKLYNIVSASHNSNKIIWNYCTAGLTT